jgi:hypothetical protein
MRRGGALAGCLVWAVLFVGLAYATSEVGAPYYRYYRFTDMAAQQARYATIRSDSAMRLALWATADSLGLPHDAYDIRIARSPNRVDITTAYDDWWAVPGYRRAVHFQVDESAPLL